MASLFANKVIFGAMHFIGLIFCIISLSTIHWATLDQNNLEIRKGLWRTCSTITVPNVGSTETCVDTIDFVKDKDKHRTVQAFMLLAFFGYLLSFASLALSFKYRVMTIAMVVLVFADIIFIAIALIVASVSSNDEHSNMSLSWSHHLGWAFFGATCGSIGVAISAAKIQMSSSTI